MNLKLNVAEIAENGRYSVCFGLKNLKDYIGAANSFDLSLIHI